MHAAHSAVQPGKNQNFAQFERRAQGVRNFMLMLMLMLMLRVLRAFAQFIIILYYTVTLVTFGH